MTLGEYIDFNVAEIAEKMRAEVRAEALVDILTELGPVPDALVSRIKESDDDTIKMWLKLTAKVTSVEEFMKLI